jgi:hypothetical protein
MPRLTFTVAQWLGLVARRLDSPRFGVVECLANFSPPTDRITCLLRHTQERWLAFRASDRLCRATHTTGIGVVHKFILALAT